MAWSSRWQSVACLVGLLLAAVLLHQANQHLRQLRTAEKPLEMQVALPVAVQVAAAGGDRYLAANLAGFRVLLASTEYMTPDTYAVQAKIQRDIAWLNPAHEDNYYIAAAILPWNQELEAAQYVLSQASRARPFDWLPAFYFAFHRYHFERNPAAAVQALAAVRNRVTDANNRMALDNLIVIWSEKGYELAQAVRIAEAMANEARPGGFRKYLLLRASRLKLLMVLREAAQRYAQLHGAAPSRFEQLRDAGLIAALPVDPFGFGYAIDDAGQPVLLNSPPKSK